MKKILSILIILLSFSYINVNASSIKMEINVDNNGNGHFKETWYGTLEKGSEVSQLIKFGDNQTISDFTVTDDLNNNYTFLLGWDSTENFDNKKYKNGINYTDDGIKLSWGISNYGKRTYTIEYTVYNLITNYSNNQGFYFTFINDELNNINILLHSDIFFKYDNSFVYYSGGLSGTTEYINGNLIVNAENYDSYDTFYYLVYFNENYFNTNRSNSNVIGPKIIYNLAYQDNYDSLYNNHYLVINIILIVILIIIICVYLVRSKLGLNKKKEDKPLNLEELMYISDKDAIIYDKIPCDGNLERIYFICKKYHIVPIDILNNSYKEINNNKEIDFNKIDNECKKYYVKNHMIQNDVLTNKFYEEGKKIVGFKKYLLNLDKIDSKYLNIAKLLNIYDNDKMIK